MSQGGSTQDDSKDPLRKIIVVIVAIAHINPMYRIIICSTDMAVAFNIPVNNIGIYFSKLSGIRSLTMSLGFTIELAISKIIETLSTSQSSGNDNSNNNNKINEIRRYMSIATLVMLTSCQVSFLLVLYISKIPSFHNYIVLALESLIFGLFQISIVSLTPKYASIYNLSLYVSGIIILITQAISDKVTNKNSVLSVKIQAWISVILCVISIALWSYYVFELYKDSKSSESNTSECSSSSTDSSPQSQTLRSSEPQISRTPQTHSQKIENGQTTIHNSHSDGSISVPCNMDPSNGLSVNYFISMSSLSLLKIMRSELKRLCTCTDNRHQVTHVKVLINVLEQIRSEDGICSRLLIRIDLVIVGLKEICHLEHETTLLEQLAFVLRGKYLLYISRCKNELTQPVAQPQNQTKQQPSTGESEKGKSRQRRNSDPKTSESKQLYEHLWQSLSQFTMFGAGSLVKDFLFPGVLPYALLEREKCHIINLTTIIFLAIGPVTIFAMDQAITEFKCKAIYYHGFWACILPKIIIFILSMFAIHTKQGCTHKIRGSQPIVLFMTLTLLMLYGFMETVSVVGISYYVKHISKDEKNSTDLQAIQRISTVFFRYLVYKFSVGYNDTRVKSGFILPHFKPPKRVPDTFCFWFKGSLANGWKDFIQDFKLNIKTYL